MNDKKIKVKTVSLTHTIYVLQLQVGDTWDDTMFVHSLYTARQHKSNFESAEIKFKYRIILRTTTDKVIEE